MGILVLHHVNHCQHLQVNLELDNLGEGVGGGGEPPPSVQASITSSENPEE